MFSGERIHGDKKDGEVRWVSIDRTAFSVVTPLGFSVSVTHERWGLITSVKHPVTSGREADVQEGVVKSG